MVNECGWIALAGESPMAPSMKGEHKADWLIVGAGITGLSAAHALARMHPNARIVVIERQRAAQGASARNSGYSVGHKYPAADELLGERNFDGYLDDCLIGRAANNEVREQVDRLSIDCEFRDSGYYYAVNDPAKLERIEQRVATLNAAGGDAKALSAEEMAQKLGTQYYHSGIWCGRGNSLLQPAKYVRGLLDALPEQVQLFEQTELLSLDRNGIGFRALCPQGSIQATKVLICLNAFTSRAGIKDSGTFPMELSASLTRPLTDDEYAAIGNVDPWGVLSTRPLGATVRLTPDRRILMRNTAEYRRTDLSQMELAERRRQHATGIQRRFPWMSEADIKYTWTGHLSASRTGQPYFGEVEKGLYSAAGCNGSGLARGTLWGRLLAEMSSGHDSALLSQVLRRANPGWLPPSPFFDIGAAMRMRKEAQMAGMEN